MSGSAGGMSFAGKDKGTWWFNLYGTRVADQTFKKQIHKIHLERNLKSKPDEVRVIGERCLRRWEVTDDQG